MSNSQNVETQNVQFAKKIFSRKGGISIEVITSKNNDSRRRAAKPASSLLLK